MNFIIIFRDDVYVYQPKGVYKSRTVSGYIFVSDSIKTLISRIIVMAKADPSTKAILILYKRTIQEVDDLLISTWELYNILNIFVFNTERIDHIHGAFYNPFLLKNDIRGFVHHFDLTYNLNIEEVFRLENRLKNVHRYPLRICIFEHPGTVSPVKDKNGTIIKYTLRDGEIIHYLANYVNFEPIYFKPTDNSLYGYAYENGTFSGALQELHSGNADILANMRAVMKIGELETQFLRSIVQVEFGFVSPKLGASDNILFINIFDWKSSLYLIFSYIGITTIWRYMQFMHNNLLNIKIGPSLLQFLQAAFGLILLISQTNPKYTVERFLFAAMLIFSMINSYTYQAKMVQYLTTSKIPLDINSMEELAKSGMTIYTDFGLKELIQDIGEDEESPDYFKVLLANQKVYNEHYEKAIHLIIEKKNIAYISGLYFCKRLAAIWYSNVTGEDVLHVITDAPPAR